MSIDKLQERIRKLKNPSVIEFCVTKEQIPEFLFDDDCDFIDAYGKFCRALLWELKGIVPAVRFSYGYFSVMGERGYLLLRELMDASKSYGYYVLLDCVEFSKIQTAEFAAQMLSALPVDGYVCYAYSGSDAVKPYMEMCKRDGKSLFVNIRTANKSAAQLQDLMTGSRLVHMAAADIVSRIGEGTTGRSGYALAGGVAAANSPDSLKTLRRKYKNMFLLIDGYDYSNANAKNCSLGFDELGHGAVVCAGSAVTAAWCDEEVDCHNFAEAAVRAAERMRKNLTRYITIL